MHEAPKMRQPIRGSRMEDVIRDFIQDVSAVTSWMQEVVEELRPSKHEDDCPAAAEYPGVCDCGVDPR